MVIDSWPPATMMSNSPARMSWSASAIASSPDRHTLLIGERRDAERDAGLVRGLAGRDLAGAGLQHLAHDHVLHLLGRDAGALERGLDGDPAEVGARRSPSASRAAGPSGCARR